MRVIVVGAGIAGLSAAYLVRAARPDVEVVVLEQSDRVGGKLRTAELAGQPFDVGAEAMLARRPEGIELLADLGLQDQRIAPLTTTAGLWIDGAAHPIPAGTVFGVPGDVSAVAASGVLSPTGLARLQFEDGADHPPLVEDVSVGSLVARMLGQEVVDRIVDPLLGGVYAGRADRISLQAAMPALAAELAAHGGSLTAAARVVTERGRAAAASGAVFASVRGGLGRIPSVLAASGGVTVRTATAVRTLRPGPEGFVLGLGAVPVEELLSADAVVVAVPPGKAAGLLGAVAPSAAAELAGIRTASVAIVSLAYAAGTTLPPGSGLLVPATSGRIVKGVTLSSQKWPGAPDGVVRLRASVGRIDEETVLQREDSELIGAVRRELAALIGVEAEPVDAIVTRWGGGLPQYEVGHPARIDRVRAAVAAVPGLAVAGASYDGVGIPACILSARRAAGRVLEHLAGRGQ